MSDTSGVGFWYGWACSEAAMLEDLLKFNSYDFDDLDQDDIDAVPSVVARLPTVLSENHWFHNPWVGADGRLID